MASLLCSLALTPSCNDLIYTPDQERIVQIPQPNTAMSLNLLNAKDTIMVFGTQNFAYSYSTKGKVFSKTVLYIDSTYAGSSTTPGEISLYSYGFPLGSHKMTLEMWANSGSGSLADREGAEFVVGRWQYNVFIDNRTYNGNIFIDSVYRANGCLNLTWTRYPYTNLKNYSVYRTYLSKSGNRANEELIATINDRSKNTFQDMGYVGGSVIYKVKVSVPDNILQSNEKNFLDTFRLLTSAKPIDAEHILLTWKKKDYYPHPGRCILQRCYVYSSSYQEYVDVRIITENSDTTYIDQAGFGATAKYRIRPYGTDYWFGLSNEIEAYTGTPITFAWSIEYNVPLHSILVDNRRLLDAETLALRAEGNVTTRISNDGRYAYTTYNAAKPNDMSHSFTQVDPISLSPIGQLMYTDQLLGYVSLNGSFVVTSDGYCFYYGERYKAPTTYAPGALVLLNVNSPELIAKDSNWTYGPARIKISNKTADGEYIIIGGGRMYNLKNKKLTRISGKSWVDAVFSLTGEQVIGILDQQITTYRCSDLSVIKSFSTSKALANISIDPATGYIGGNVSGTPLYRIYDPSNGRLIKEIKLCLSETQSIPGCYLANSYLFSTLVSGSVGFYTKITY